MLNPKHITKHRFVLKALVIYFHTLATNGPKKPHLAKDGADISPEIHIQILLYISLMLFIKENQGLVLKQLKAGLVFIDDLFCTKQNRLLPKEHYTYGKAW